MSTYEKCKSCKYYKEHYIIRGTFFHPLDGHCMCSALISTRKRDTYRLEENYGYWEENTEMRKNKAEEIKDVIREMNEHLQHIENILEIIS